MADECWLRDQIVRECPQQLKLPFALWTRPAIKALIRARFGEDATRKIFLVADNLRVHHAKQVSEWLQDKSDRIELVFLPPYALESNPDEYSNRDFKTTLRNGPVSQNAEGLLEKAQAFMNRIAALPHHVAACFKHPAAIYASPGYLRAGLINWVFGWYLLLAIMVTCVQLGLEFLLIRTRPQLILLSDRACVVDGIDVAQAIRAVPDGRTIKVLILASADFI